MSEPFRALRTVRATLADVKLRLLTDTAPELMEAMDRAIDTLDDEMVKAEREAEAAQQRAWIQALPPVDLEAQARAFLFVNHAHEIE